MRRRCSGVSSKSPPASSSEAFEGHTAAADLLDEAEHRIIQLSQIRGGVEFTRIKELLWPTMERIEALSKGGKSITGVASGFADLDEITSGFQPSDLIIVAARPAMGKTAFCLGLAQHAAIEHNVPIALFSLEMSKESLVQRLLTSEARIDAQRLRKGLLRDDDFPRLARAAGILELGADLHRRQRRDHAARDAVARAAAQGRCRCRDDHRRLPAAHPGPARSENRQQEISQISRSLKALAKELQVPVIALSQLSRAPEQRTGESKRPQLSDLRESGAIEQDADLVMFIYRPEVYEGLDGQGRQLARRPVRNHRRETAQWSHGHREPLLPQDLHPVRELHGAKRRP